ncbi:acylphosphatase [Granulicoccus sp. GXG6511]|uniref:acylphosphatase n=1 Tax=Granulicoccus sp. GXG6511 TaxID=3381351 RepID=UPI003D7DD24A
MNRIRIHGVVSGRVQGVSYRYSMKREAHRLGVAGWVRNLPDGRVEFEAEGERSAVEALVAWAGEGPAYARVDRVLTSDRQVQGDQEFVTRS